MSVCISLKIVSFQENMKLLICLMLAHFCTCNVCDIETIISPLCIIKMMLKIAHNITVQYTEHIKTHIVTNSSKKYE